MSQQPPRLWLCLVLLVVLGVLAPAHAADRAPPNSPHDLNSSFPISESALLEVESGLRVGRPRRELVYAFPSARVESDDESDIVLSDSEFDRLINEISEQNEPDWGLLRTRADDLNSAVTSLLMEKEDPDLVLLLHQAQDASQRDDVRAMFESGNPEGAALYIQFTIDVAAQLSKRTEQGVRRVSLYAVVLALEVLLMAPAPVRNFVHADGRTALHELMSYRLLAQTEVDDGVRELIRRMSTESVSALDQAGQTAFTMAIRRFPEQKELLEVLLDKSDLEGFTRNWIKSVDLDTLPVWSRLFHGRNMRSLALLQYDMDALLDLLELRDPFLRRCCAQSLYIRSIWYDPNSVPSLAPYAFVFFGNDEGILSYYGVQDRDELLSQIAPNCSADCAQFLSNTANLDHNHLGDIDIIIQESKCNPERNPFIIALNQLSNNLNNRYRSHYMELALYVSKAALLDVTLPNSVPALDDQKIDFVFDVVASLMPDPVAFEQATTLKRVTIMLEQAASSPLPIFSANLAVLAARIIDGLRIFHSEQSLILLGRAINHKSIFGHRAALPHLSAAFVHTVMEFDSCSELRPVFFQFFIVLLNNPLLAEQTIEEIEMSMTSSSKGPARRIFRFMHQVLSYQDLAEAYQSCPYNPFILHKLFPMKSTDFNKALLGVQLQRGRDQLLKPVTTQDIEHTEDCCPICFEDHSALSHSEPSANHSVKLRCGHLYHASCLSRNLSVSMLCPICRQLIPYLDDSPLRSSQPDALVQEALLHVSLPHNNE